MIQPQPFGHAGREVLHHHVAARRQVQEQPPSPRAAQVDRHAALVAVHRQEVGAQAGRRVSEVGRPPGARVVAARRPFHLDHVGAHVGQHHRAIGTGQHARRIEHPNPRQRRAAAGPLLSRHDGIMPDSPPPAGGGLAALPDLRDAPGGGSGALSNPTTRRPRARSERHTSPGVAPAVTARVASSSPGGGRRSLRSRPTLRPPLASAPIPAAAANMTAGPPIDQPRCSLSFAHGGAEHDFGFRPRVHPGAARVRTPG